MFLGDEVFFFFFFFLLYLLYLFSLFVVIICYLFIFLFLYLQDWNWFGTWCERDGKFGKENEMKWNLKLQLEPVERERGYGLIMEINNDLEIMENFIKGNNWTTRVLYPLGKMGWLD